MTSRNRETLKNYFGNGQLPTQSHFADLVDSMLNMVDEGFRKTVANGHELYAPVGHHNLLSFYRDQTPQQALWRISLGPTQDQLQFRPSADVNPLLSLDAKYGVGIGTAQPEAKLDVRGTVGCQGRKGMRPVAEQPLRADGKWHDLTEDLEGCQAFEVMAGVGLRESGHFGMLHAIAMSAYNPGGWLWWRDRRGIRQTNAWWGRRCDKLHLRWHGTHGRKAAYRLQIRSGCNLGADVQIQAHITELWFDTHMAKCDLKNGAAP